jgi:hypothetical protein
VNMTLCMELMHDRMASNLIPTGHAADMCL